ncbi:MAG: integrase [Fimbriimonadaceae bacterium]|jgi:integrase|nr:integrase [Fimbriimonadaceae bacterium]
MGVFQLGNGRWRGVLTYKDEFGVSQHKQFSGKTAAIVKRRMKTFREREEAGQVPDNMTVDRLCEIAIERCEEKGLESKTLTGYKDYRRLHINPTIGAVKIQELKPVHVERMMKLMLKGQTWVSRQEKNKTVYQQPCEIGTALLCRNFLRMALNRVGIKEGLIEKNAAALADLPEKITRRTFGKLSQSDVEKIIDLEPRQELKALWITLATLGHRPDEGIHLAWPYFYEQEDGWWVKLPKSKSEEGKMPVPVPAKLMEVLQTLPRRSVSFVFTTEKGTPFSYRNISRAWLGALDRAQVPRTRLYELRHYCGAMRSRTVKDDVLRRLMRHTDVRTTKQYYVYAFAEDMRRAVEE